MPPETPPTRRNLLIRMVEFALFSGRWLLAPLYLTMLVLLALLVARFVLEVVHAVPGMLSMTDRQVLILTLSLIDLSLVANLVVLVILTGYENFVARINLAERDIRPAWMGNIDFSGLKQKLLGSVTAIAAIHVLRSFLELGSQSSRTVILQGGLMLAFVITGVLLALTDRIAGHD